jgi:hypothetical protein
MMGFFQKAARSFIVVDPLPLWHRVGEHFELHPVRLAGYVAGNAESIPIDMLSKKVFFHTQKNVL